MAQGWVCVHRQIIDNPIFKNDKLFRVFMYCLLKASHTDCEQLVGDAIVSVKQGQLVSGRKSIARATNLTEMNIRTALNKLEKLNILTIKPTNKYSIISILNWDRYQQSNQQVTSKQPASNQHLTTNNNVNNDNNDNKPLDQSKIDREKLELNAFEYWWKSYPKKVAKASALKSWKKAIKKMDEEKVRALTNHIVSDVKLRLDDIASGSDKFIGFDRLHATTYLNQERYNDDI